MNKECNKQTGENITWNKDEKGRAWNVPADYWYERESSKADFRVVVEDGENCGTMFKPGDVIEVSATVDDLRPGDLVVTVDRHGAAVRRLKSFSNVNGRVYGKAKAIVEMSFPVEGPREGVEEVGRVLNLIRDLEDASRKA